LISFDTLTSYDIKNSHGIKGPISYLDAVVKPIRKMMLSSEMGNLEIFNNLEKIDKYLQDEDAVIKFLYTLPILKQGIGLIAEGLFSSNSDIAHLSVKIIQKI